MELEVLTFQMRALLEAKADIRLALIFGSHAARKATLQSDIDIALAAETTLSVEQKLALADEISRTFQREVDLVDLHSAHGALLQEILTRGVVVVNSDPSLYEKFIKRMLAEKEDDSRVAAKAIAERIRRWSLQTKR
jgi:predicted nucleotidyltransferase